MRRRPDGWLDEVNGVKQADHESIAREVQAGLRCAACRQTLNDREGSVATPVGPMHHVCAVREGHMTVEAPKPSVRFTKQDLFG